MTGYMGVLKEPLQELLRRYAYLDLEVRLGGLEPPEGWTMAVEVACDDKGDGSVMLIVTPELAEEAARNIFGSRGRTGDLQADVVGELANIIAGQTYEILQAGRKPVSIDQPRAVDAPEVLDAWTGAAPHCRYVLCSPTGTVAGILLSLTDNWIPFDDEQKTDSYPDR